MLGIITMNGNTMEVVVYAAREVGESEIDQSSIDSLDPFGKWRETKSLG